MEVRYPRPSERLLPYVQSILVVENQQVVAPFVLPLFANGTPTLLFSTVPGQIATNTDHLLLFGQTVLPETLLLPGNFKIFAYFLKPYALSILFNVSASELVDRPVCLDLVTGRSQLQDRLLNATSTDQTLQLIDEYLLSRITAIRREDKRLIYAVEKIHGDPRKNVLKEIRQELYMTERTFERMFEREIGVSPVLFRRISQFSKAFRQVNERTLPDLSTITYRNGYTDQSHFIRAFKEFTGFTPSAYLKAKAGI
ncbi:MAG TPA: AraC family transcriptional regulator [Puia sp.]|jgi:AraC-like DNA-binding protein